MGLGTAAETADHLGGAAAVGTTMGMAQASAAVTSALLHCMAFLLVLVGPPALMGLSGPVFLCCGRAANRFYNDSEFDYASKEAN